MELWSITALGKVDTEFVVSAFFFVITGQARAQPARLDPNNESSRSNTSTPIEYSFRFSLRPPTVSSTTKRRNRFSRST